MPIRLFVFAAALVAMTASAFAQTGQVEIADPWARATPAGATTGAAYLTIQSPVADRLVGVSSIVAKEAQLHTMTTDGGVMRMRPLAGIDLPAGQAVTLKPGGMHVMLSGLVAPLKEGQSFPLTLQFEKAGERQVSVTVEKIGAMGPPGGASPMPH